MSRIISAYEDRMRRAYWLFQHGAVHKQEDGSFVVESQFGNGSYNVSVTVADNGHELISQGHCDCPDWARMQEAINEWPLHPGISQIDFVPACKHLLAALLADGVLMPPAFAHSA